MEQPSHDLRAQMGGTAAQAAPRRVGGLVIVVLLHIGIVVGLIAGLKAGDIAKKIEDIKVSVEKEKVLPKAPPPPPPDVVKPPPPFVPPPEFTVTNEAPPSTSISISAVKPPVAPPAQPPAPPPTKLEAIMRTHITPPYPPISVRLGEQGTVTLKVTISTSGDVTAAEIQKTSGSDRLDQAAAEYVKSHYKWKPPTTNGQPTEAITLVAVIFNLKDANR